MESNQENCSFLKNKNFDQQPINRIRSQSTENKVFSGNRNFLGNSSYNSFKKVLTNTNNNNFFEVNSKYSMEAEENFKILKIDPFINNWINNCQRWFFKTVLSQFWKENVENIFELNHELNRHFGRYLHEVQIFDQAMIKVMADNKYSRITIEDLLLNTDSIKKNFLNLEPISSDFKKIQEINKNFKLLMETRKKFESYLMISGYETHKIRFMKNKFVTLNIFKATCF